MVKADLAKVYKKDPGTIVKLMDEELIILPLGEGVSIGDLGSFYVLRNKTARYIWKLINGRNSIEDIKDAVLQDFEVAPDKAGSDICGFLRELHKIKAIL